MAALTGNTIASTYKDLLQVSNSNSGVDGTLRSVEDGEGTASVLQISSSAVKVGGTVDLDGAVTINESGADVDFRVETTGNTHGFHIDAGNNVVNINSPLSSDTQSTPEEVLALKTFYTNAGTDGAAGAGTQLTFYIPDDETNPAKGAGIAGLRESGDDSNMNSALAFYTSGNDESISEKGRFDSNGFLRVGTIGPSRPLHISSAENQVARFESTDAYAGIELKDNGSSTLPPLISALSDDILFYGGHGSSRPLIMTLDSSTASVGIGTSSPTNALLEVVTDNENVARFDGLQGNIDFRYGSDIEFDRAGQVYITANNGSGELNFRTGGQNTRMHIDSSGNVGIGEDSPTGLLELAASGNTNKYLTLDNATGNNFIQFGADNGAYACMWTEYGSGDLYIGTGVKPVGTNTNAFYSSYGGGNISRTAIVMDAFGDQGIKFHTASESTVSKDSAVTNAERMRLEHSGNLVMQNKTNGLANNIKFAGTASYDNGSYTSHSLSGSGAIVIITNHTADSSALFHMEYNSATITMIANPNGVGVNGFNNAGTGTCIRVTKSAGSFSFTVSNDTGATRSIGVGIISMHES